MPRIYVETSVISYFAARPSRDIVVASHQRVTSDWWQYVQGRHELVMSQVVVVEAAAGDPAAAAERLRILAPIELLNIGDEAQTLADELIRSGALPATAGTDALHVGVAATNGVKYLVTWNFRHLANPILRQRVAEECLKAGYQPPIVCTPEEMLEARL